MIQCYDYDQNAIANRRYNYDDTPIAIRYNGDRYNVDAKITTTNLAVGVAGVAVGVLVGLYLAKKYS